MEKQTSGKPLVFYKKQKMLLPNKAASSITNCYISYHVKNRENVPCYVTEKSWACWVLKDAQQEKKTSLFLKQDRSGKTLLAS